MFSDRRMDCEKIVLGYEGQAEKPFQRREICHYGGTVCAFTGPLSLLLSVAPRSLTMGQLYEKERDEDGFLYVAYSGENTFGF